MAVVYRKDIAPAYRGLIADGLTRYADHKATSVALKLAEELLNYRAPQHTIRYSIDTGVQRVMEELRAHDVTPMAVLQRIAEATAWLEDNPAKLRNPRAERFMMARCLTHLVSRNHVGKRVSANVLSGTGDRIAEYLGQWANAFVRKLAKDRAALATMKREAVAYDD